MGNKNYFYCLKIIKKENKNTIAIVNGLLNIPIVNGLFTINDIHLNSDDIFDDIADPIISKTSAELNIPKSELDYYFVSFNQI